LNIKRQKQHKTNQCVLSGTPVLPMATSWNTFVLSNKIYSR